MATTTNYAWETPDDTDLVKDGAAAIRTLGSSIDTTTKALNPSTTLGDIEYRSATANTNTRLPIGTSGQILTVSSGVPAWATASSGGMTLISTTSLTGSSVTISSIPSTYKNLQLIIRNILPTNDGDGVTLRLNSDTGTRYQLRAFSSTNQDSIDFDQNDIAISAALDNPNNQNLIVIDIFDYANTTTWKMGSFVSITPNYTTSTQFSRRAAMMYYNQTSAISAINLICGGGGTFTSGTALLYGVQ
jgi:hypothetical protein